jgi:hypothetical protein
VLTFVATGLLCLIGVKADAKAPFVTPGAAYSFFPSPPPKALWNWSAKSTTNSTQRKVGRKDPIKGADRREPFARVWPSSAYAS